MCGVESMNALVPATSAADGQRVVEAWNQMAQRAGLPRVKLMTQGRATHLRKRIEQVGLDGMLEAVALVEQSAFCCGENDRGWCASLDFILQQSSLIRLLEGGYQSCQRDARRHTQSVNGAAIALARLDAQIPLIEGNVYESD